MAVPFRRTSKTKKRMRRTHLKKTISSMTTCSNCGATIKNHRMCTKCGFYKGKEIVKKVETKVETKDAPKKAEKATKKIAKTGVTKTTKETKNSKK